MDSKSLSKNQLQRELDNKLQVISEKETVISKQSELLIKREAEIRTLLDRVDKEVELSTRINKSQTKLKDKYDKLLTEYNDCQKIINICQDNYKKQRDELSKLQNDKHLPKNKFLNKLTQILINIDKLKK